MRNLWNLLGQSAPERNAERRTAFAKALERLLLVSTSGAFFFALARSIPVHAQELTWPPNWIYTLDLFLRYLCLVWFLAYFFVSSVHNDKLKGSRDAKDLGFDALQSIAVLAATYALGFVLPDRGFAFKDGLYPFVFSNAVVLLICLTSLWLFADTQNLGLNRVRWFAAAVALVAIAVSLCALHSVLILGFLLFLQFLLWLAWWAYFRIRLDIDVS